MWSISCGWETGVFYLKKIVSLSPGPWPCCGLGALSELSPLGMKSPGRHWDMKNKQMWPSPSLAIPSEGSLGGHHSDSCSSQSKTCKGSFLRRNKKRGLQPLCYLTTGYSYSRISLLCLRYASLRIMRVIATWKWEDVLLGQQVWRGISFSTRTFSCRTWGHQMKLLWARFMTNKGVS